MILLFYSFNVVLIDFLMLKHEFYFYYGELYVIIFYFRILILAVSFKNNNINSSSE